MKKATNIILIVIGLIAIVIFKQIAKKEVRENAVNNALQENSSSIENSIVEKVDEQNWFNNTQFGLVFETPKAMKEVNFEIPQGTEEYIKKVYSYILKDNDMGISYMIMETYFKQYDTKEGLRGAVSNFINTANGRNLSVDFFDIQNDYNDKECTGTFLYQNSRMKVHGYCLYNESGRVYMLIASGANNENVNKKIDRIFNSIKILNLQ